MSQALQQHHNLTMYRDEHLLATASALMPTLYSQAISPVSVINTVPDSHALHG